MLILQPQTVAVGRDTRRLGGPSRKLLLLPNEG